METFEKGLSVLDSDIQKELLEKYKSGEKVEAKNLLLVFLKMRCIAIDNLITKFLDTENLNNFETKVSVMLDIIDGKPSSNITNYYDALDLMPNDDDTAITRWD